jgi:hypothetical protein
MGRSMIPDYNSFLVVGICVLHRRAVKAHFLGGVLERRQSIVSGVGV